MSCALRELYDIGFTLRDAGFTASELFDAGFTLTELNGFGFTAMKLYDAGFTLKELHDAGFTLNELHAGSYGGFSSKRRISAKELYDAGFKAKELRKLDHAGASWLQENEGNSNSEGNGCQPCPACSDVPWPLSNLSVEA